MTNIKYTKKVMELRKKHGFDTQLKLPAYVDILEKEIITNNEKHIKCKCKLKARYSEHGIGII